MTRASTRNKTTVAEPAAARAVAAAKTKISTKSKGGDGKENNHADQMVKPPTRRISNEFDRTGDTLYMSAIDL